MEDANFSNIFRKATGNFFCPACGSKYQGTEIEAVEKRDTGYLVSVSCHNCQLKLTMQVVTKGFSQLDVSGSDSDDDITVDEIIDFHEMLKGFDGNFRRIFMPRIDQNRHF